MRRTLAQLAVVAFLPAVSSAAVLYSGSGLPSDQGAAYVNIGPAVQSAATPGVTLNTAALAGIYAGYFYSLPTGTLDKAAGFDVSITAALLSSPVTTPTRAGLSFLLLTSDHTGVELALQPGLIFAQAEGFGSPTGESASFDTSKLTDYHITVSGGTYALSADGTPILTGPLRDYSATTTPFDGTPAGPVYSQHDLLFIGDDTSSASGSFRFAAAAVVPEPGLALPALLGGAMLARRRRR